MSKTVVEKVVLNVFCSAGESASRCPESLGSDFSETEISIDLVRGKDLLDKVVRTGSTPVITVNGKRFAVDFSVVPLD